jgi:hypothetical protein
MPMRPLTNGSSIRVRNWVVEGALLGAGGGRAGELVERGQNAAGRRLNRVRNWLGRVPLLLSTRLTWLMMLLLTLF